MKIYRKLFVGLAILIGLPIAFPHAASAQTPNNSLVFQITIKDAVGKKLIVPVQSIEVESKDQLVLLLSNYLSERNSPMAPCAADLVELKNFKKILSLSAAESSFGVRSPYGLYNYWGVGGSNLWKMGNNPCEAVRAMDDFLNNFPRRSEVKYTDMSYERMCGLYKQPCANPATHHWTTNNKTVVNQVTSLEAIASQQTLEKMAMNNDTTIAQK